MMIKGKQIPAALMGLLLVIAGVGAAAGVTMQGDAQGDITTSVDQAIVVDDAVETSGNADNALGTVSDDGTKFKFAASINQGDAYKVSIRLKNIGEQGLNGRLELDVPEPLEVEVSGSDGASAARSSMYTWILSLDSGNVEEQLSASPRITTSEAVADRNDDNQITAADIDLTDGPGPVTNTDFSVATVNDDGTVVLVDDNNQNFEPADTISYESQQHVTITVATPDDIEPGFYTVEGEIRPEEV